MPFFTMTKTVLKSLFKKPATRRYPFAPRTYPARSRGSIAIDISACIFCGMCSRKCPTAALTVDAKQKSWEIDRLRCITCGYCVDVCPEKCLRMHSAYTPATKDREKERFSRA